MLIFVAISMLTGARQTGKSFILNLVARKIFRNVVKIDPIEDYMRYSSIHVCSPF